MANARTLDPLTSHLAAASVTNQKTIRHWVYKLLATPRTDADLVELFAMTTSAPRASQSGIRTRRAELVADGQVVDSGRRVKLVSGRYATVWERA